VQKICESEKEYRFGDSGPKYFMRGPRISCGVVILKPGQDFKNHYHRHMEENFFLLEGQLDFYINDQLVTCKSGELMHVEPNETHYLINNYDEPAKAVFILAPYTDNDKVEIY
jgi:quercetin dioxygenase-like cupin family protein